MARGYIENRGTDSWRLVYETGRSFNGKRDRRMKTVKAKTRREAEKALSRFINEIENGLTTDNDDIKFEKFVEIWRKDYAEEQLAPKTYFEYDKYLRFRVLPAMGKFKLKDITDKVLRQFYRTLKEPSARRDGKSGQLASRTVLHYYMFLSALLEKAVKWGYMAINPNRKIESPKVSKHQIKIYDENELSLLIECLKTAPLKYKLMTCLSLSLGNRRGEVMGLEWPDINLETGLVNINKASQSLPGKGTFTKRPKNEHSVRDIHISQSLIPLLTQFKKEQDAEREKVGSLWHNSGKIFVQWDGRPMHTDTISKWFSKFLKRNNLGHITFGSLRHSSSSILTALGVNVKTVSARLGHASITTTMNIYGHAIKSADRDAAEKLDELFQKMKNGQDE